MDERARHRRGMKMRRAVLGDAWVDRAVRETTALDRAFQDLLTRYAWGEIWTRPRLPRPTRRLLTIAMMVALGREDELRLHLRAAAADGVPARDIEEVLLQAAVYCGLPAANAAFKLAKEVLGGARRGSTTPPAPAPARRRPGRTRRRAS